MSVSLYSITVETFASRLGTLSQLLDKAAAHAREKNLDPATLVNARLAPDMFTLARQVQIACDQAKFAAARLTGREPPRVEDNETTIEELKARIAKTLDYLKTAPQSAFAGADERKISFPLPGDLSVEMTGAQYAQDWIVPQFYFHMVTAYDILRHLGVQIGKIDFMAHAGYAIRPRPAAA
ncbi:MAG TPA: DUF1993 domain-containing protein [Alphaproteobacteria bacterium]|nr:DUF1993 domain-containing protein [Alphaproteobacteria bacterium]